MKIENGKITATPGHFIHRVGDSAYFESAYILPGDTLEKFEEVDAIPEPEEPGQDRESRIVARVRQRYSVDDELAILRQRDTEPEKFAAYFDYVEAITREEK